MSIHDKLKTLQPAWERALKRAYPKQQRLMTIGVIGLILKTDILAVSKF